MTGERLHAAAGVSQLSKQGRDRLNAMPGVKLAATNVWLPNQVVAQRTQEMGIRMALGADRSAIRKLVVWHGMRLTVAGVVLGIAAAFGLTRLISSFLFGVKSWDPVAFLSALLLLTAVALFAIWQPAIRASKINPMKALSRE